MLAGGADDKTDGGIENAPVALRWLNVHLLLLRTPAATL